MIATHAAYLLQVRHIDYFAATEHHDTVLRFMDDLVDYLETLLDD